jgi:hypothetical protein
LFASSTVLFFVQIHLIAHVNKMSNVTTSSIVDNGHDAYNDDGISEGEYKSTQSIDSGKFDSIFVYSLCYF